MEGSVTVHMNASADVVWALVSDITRIGEFSPETFEAEWLEGATGPALGATFRGHVKRNEWGPTYWTTCTVTSCESGADFGFKVVINDYPVNNWRYQIAPAGDGVDVTESFFMTPNLGTKIYATTIGRLRKRRNLNDMRRTLERMKAVVEA
jgi:hypothetical protein